MPRSPLTESIQKVRRLVTEIQGTLTVDEFNLLLDELVPEPEPEAKPVKKTKKKDGRRCQAELVSGAKCNMTASHGIHDAAQKHNYVESHVFLPKKPSQPSSKSPRASGIHAQLKERRQQREPVTTKDDNYDPLTDLRCAREGCGWLQGDLIHDPQGGYVGYHPFELAAPPAPAPSPANGGAGSGTVNSGTQPEDVSTVVHEASGGD